MKNQEDIKKSVAQIQRIVQHLVPNNSWYNIHFEGYIVGTVTEVKAWYTVLGSEEMIEFNAFNIDYINEDAANNSCGIFVEKIREEMYDKSIGSWYTIMIDFYKKDIAPICKFNYSDIPKFEEPLPLSIYKKDLLRFPRPIASIPSWLQ